MRNIKMLKERAIKAKKPFTSTPKKRCHLLLFDFEKPIKESKYKKTNYLHYHCRFITINNEGVSVGNHIIMLPMKTCWLQLYDELEQKDLLKKKNLTITIMKVNNYTYSITIHNT